MWFLFGVHFSYCRLEFLHFPTGCNTWTTCLQGSGPRFMVTVFQGSNILSNSLSALVVLGEMDGEPWWQYCGYLGCIFGMMSGLILLVRGEQNQRVTSSMDLKAVPLDDESTVLSSSEEASVGGWWVAGGGVSFCSLPGLAFFGRSCYWAGRLVAWLISVGCLV